MQNTRVPRAALLIGVILAVVGVFLAVSRAAATGPAQGAGGDLAGTEQARQRIVPLARNARKLKRKPPSAYLDRQYGSTVAQQSSTTVDFVLKPGSGDHTVRLCAFGAPGVTAYSRTLVLETVAKGPSGGASLAAPAPRSAPDRDADPATPR